MHRLLSILLSVSALAWVRPADPQVAPVFRLETGLHTAAIRSMAVSRDGRALTAAEDKTARVWDLATGRLQATIRPPVGSGKAGMLYAAAISPDGRTAALGGWTRASREAAHHIYLVDLRTGRFSQVLEAGPEVVDHLAFSPDGQRLVAHLGGQAGLRAFATRDGRLLAQDPDYAQPSYRGAFDALGRYVATADDGFIRLYDPAFRRIAKVRAPAEHPFGAAFSPDGALLALGFLASPRVEVLHGQDLSPAFSPGPGDRSLGLVAWSADGLSLYGSGGEDYGPGPNELRCWSRGGRGPARDIALARATVSDICPLADGSVAFASQDPAWGVVDPQGRLRILQPAQPEDLQAAREAFAIDGKALQVGVPGGLPDTFSVADLALEQGPVPRTARLSAPGLAVSGWRDGAAPALNGHLLPLEPGELSRALAIAPDGQGFLLGTDWHLRSYAPSGGLRWSTRTPAAVWGLVQADAGRVAVALLADGTERWYRTADGSELAALFVAADRRWVLWTPSGEFATCPGGEPLVGWQVNRPGREAAFFPMSQFRDRFYKPERMLPLLENPDAPAPAQTPEEPPALQDLPPVLEILDPAEGAPLRPGRATFAIALRAFGASPPLRGIQAFLDGARVPCHWRPRPGPPGGETQEGQVDVILPAQATAMSLLAVLADGRQSQPAERKLVVGAAPQAVIGTEALTLRILAVGVSDYADPQFNLGFAAKDARDIADLFQAQAGKLFDKVEVRLLVDAKATGKAILDAMADLARTSNPGSVTLYFISSHGGLDEGRSGYFMVPHDYSQGSQGVPGAEIQSCLEATQGRAVLLLDTCHSGSVLGEGKMRGILDMRRTRFINELLQSNPGLVVLSSSAGTQVSLESPEWGNGAFTKALREGLAGAADPGHTGGVTTDMLETYVRQRVSELTKGQQTPVAARAGSTQGFPLAWSEGSGQ